MQTAAYSMLFSVVALLRKGKSALCVLYSTVCFFLVMDLLHGKGVHLRKEILYMSTILSMVGKAKDSDLLLRFKSCSIRFCSIRFCSQARLLFGNVGLGHSRGIEG